MTWMLTAVLCVILIEVVVRLPLPVILSDINTVARKAMHVLGAKLVSDHWKEKAMLAYASAMFTSTFKLAGLLIAVAAVIVLFIYTVDQFGFGVGDFIIGWIGILYSMVVATAWFQLRKLFA